MNQDYRYPVNPGMQPAGPSDIEPLLKAAVTGAILGGAGAAAANLHAVRQGNTEWQQAAENTAKVALAAGAATAAATAVGSLFKQGSLFSIVATITTATAAMYVLNQPSKKDALEVIDE